jgi:hypothetical protein
MPISRAAFQVKMPGDTEIAVEDLTQPLDDVGDAPSQSATGGQKTADVADYPPRISSAPEGDQEGMRGSLREFHREIFSDLPPADATSAGKQDDIGAARPRMETRRSVATGRDVPHFTQQRQQRETNEIDWDEARGRTEVMTRRAEGQKSAASEHLTRIHGIVEQLLDVADAQHSDNGRKLQSLEDKVAHLEMRFSLNRSAP